MYLHNNAGNGIFQDGMFHKRKGKSLEDTQIYRSVSVWYDKYVGRLPQREPPFSLQIQMILLMSAQQRFQPLGHCGHLLRTPGGAEMDAVIGHGEFLLLVLGL